MRNIDASPWMSTPKLQVIETRKGRSHSNNFTLTTSLTFPDKNKNKGDKS